MLEGLAVWAAFIYLLRMVGVPWTKPFQIFAYVGGGCWLVFVWIGLLNYTPMDLSGGSYVQSPRIQLRPGDIAINGKIGQIYVKPNQTVEKGQLIYDLETSEYTIGVERAKAELNNQNAQLQTAKEDVSIAIASADSARYEIDNVDGQLAAARIELKLQQSTTKRFENQNRVAINTISETEMEQQHNLEDKAEANVNALQASLLQSRADAQKATLNIARAEAAVAKAEAEVSTAEQELEEARRQLNETKIFAPTDGYLTNFIARPGQIVARMPRMHMYTNEKYVLMRVNHQAIRNIKVGHAAEFSTPVYPGHVFAAEVEGIIEATGESQPSIWGVDENVRATTGQNARNKHHLVRLRIIETEGYDIPVGSAGLAWISGDKPISFMAFLDVIRGIILRMKAQLYYVYSI
ncbi:HlyD family secretion protein [Ferrimonas lipolytica]|uniref:Biotin/lipoyl-binding protein n=1 Tax=Ferrimonas lipolytica TaxID=2724191 RepID=A0A6H1U9L3_9GAMM|nr:efflux RND transporter periplasmic adaptor subunit [Ferrimonas lipolytica]QIZ75731.1 biotin/lipoyl-binding protein [Ferrimonas lipolytica]